MKDEPQKLENVVKAHRVRVDVAADELSNTSWEAARPVYLTRYWSGSTAPPERHAEARLIWSEQSLAVRFSCRQREPLVVHPTPQTLEKTIGLWERDVCEIFVVPNAREPERYFEFEAAPTGEWIDLALHLGPKGRETNWRYRSGMTASVHLEAGGFQLAMRVPWEAFNHKPRRGERWRVNLYRCVGGGQGRGYLAWQPTRTEQPNFHVPEAFGWLHFED